MIFVTGAGGNVGRAIVNDLRQRGMAYRMGVRTGRDQFHAEPFDVLKPETFESAIADGKVLFLLRPPP